MPAIDDEARLRESLRYLPELLGLRPGETPVVKLEQAELVEVDPAVRDRALLGVFAISERIDEIVNGA